MAGTPQPLGRTVGGFGTHRRELQDLCHCRHRPSSPDNWDVGFIEVKHFSGGPCDRLQGARAS